MTQLQRLRSLSLTGAPCYASKCHASSVAMPCPLLVPLHKLVLDLLWLHKFPCIKGDPDRVMLKERCSHYVERISSSCLVPRAGWILAIVGNFFSWLHNLSEGFQDRRKQI